MSAKSKSSLMNVGDFYRVRSGEFAGLDAKIVDPQPFPDTDVERRRKITVEVQTNHGPESVYLLPRMLEDRATQVATRPALVAVEDGPQEHFTAHTPDGTPIILPGDITDVDDPRLDPWRPDPKIVRGYVSRMVPPLRPDANGNIPDDYQGVEDVDFLLSFWEQRENILLVGDTQAGKTMLVQVLAVLAGRKRKKDGTGNGKPLPVFTLSGSSGVTDFDLFGQPVPYADPTGGPERLVALPGVVDLAAKAGGILYLDEINMMSERVTSSLHSITDHRRMFVNRGRAVRIVRDQHEIFMPEVVQCSPDLWVFGTINPGYRGAGALNEAFTNRFVWIEWGYDEEVEKKLIPSAAVRLLGQALRQARAQRSISTPVGTAALQRLCDHILTHGIDTGLWMFKAMFQPAERPKVETIIVDRTVLALLKDEERARTA